jgi:hypothetical protein
LSLDCLKLVLVHRRSILLCQCLSFGFLLGPNLVCLVLDNFGELSLNLSAAISSESLLVDVMRNVEEPKDESKNQHEQREEPNDECESHGKQDNAFTLLGYEKSPDVLEKLANE